MQRERKLIALLLVVSMAMLLIAGCSAKTSSGNSATDNVIKIASVTPLSGQQAAIGVDIKNGSQMAFEEHKSDIEKLGFTMEFVAQDDQADPKMGVNVAQKLLADKDVLAVDGHWNSGVAIPSSEVYAKDNLAMVSPANTAVAVTDRKLPNVNRICARDDEQGPLGADYAAKELGVKTVFIIQDKTTYGQGVADEFQKQAIADGVNVLGYEGITTGESDFSEVLNKAAAAKPDLVYFGGIYPEGSQILKQMRDKGIAAKFMGPDGMDDAELIKIAGNAAIGAYITSPAGNLTLVKGGADWIGRFTKEFGNVPCNWSVFGYDAMDVILDGIKNAITANGGKKPSRLQVSQAIRAIQDFQGISSTISFDDKGDNKDAKLYVEQFKQAKYPATVVKETTVTEYLKK